jgi:UDP-N-acetylmuramoylalanine--D-glutamate ligase
MKLELNDKQVLVLGLGDTGLSALRWLKRQGARLSVADTRETPPGIDAVRAEFPGIPVHLGSFKPAAFADAAVVVASPGVPLAEPEVQAAIARGIPVVGDVELFAQAIAGSKAKVIAITGSNGKSTVTSLAGHLCTSAGLDTVIAGNIGLPVLDALAEREVTGEMPKVWVLELSSFQLETTSSLHADAATVLNISADHMDRYAGLGEYAAAKQAILRGCKVQVLNRDDAMTMAMRQENADVQTFGLQPGTAASEWGLLERDGRRWLAKGHERLFAVDELPIAGLHNAANALAALALCRAIGLQYEPMLAALKTFKGLAHRVEFVAEVNGRKFYDDSKGTNVGATAAALQGFAEPVVLIAGGDGKGQDFTPLRDAVAKTRAVVQIGRDGPQIEKAIAGACHVQRAESMEEAVQQAYALSEPGDVVLLSPACASWDMFRNYAHRAEVFINAVKELN